MNNNEKKDIEELLKNKMSDLSSSIDCFDRIASKAYDQNDNSFETGETVSDLENVTGRKNVFSVLKWCAWIAASLVLFSVLPKTAFKDNNMSGLSADSHDFKRLIEEINEELNTNTYITYEFPLSYYSQNALIVTPLYECPFSAVNCENKNVKLYVRTINDIPTNQIYAVEYKGSCIDENIIAAAETSADISQDDIDSLDIPSLITNIKNIDDIAVSSLFCDKSSDKLISPNGEHVNLVSIEYPSYYKTTTNFFPLYSFVLYGTDLDSGINFYDMKTLCRDKNDFKNDNSWKCSLYSNGCSAFPSSNCSRFIKKDIFSKAPLFSENEFAFLSIKNSSDNLTSDYDNINCSIINLDDSIAADFGNIQLPLCISKYKIYLPASPIEKNIRLRVRLCGSDPASIKLYTTSSVFFNEYFYQKRIYIIEAAAAFLKKSIDSESSAPEQLKKYNEKYDSLIKLSESLTQMGNNSCLLSSKANDDCTTIPYDIENARKIIENFLNTTYITYK